MSYIKKIKKYIWVKLMFKYYPRSVIEKKTFILYEVFYFFKNKVIVVYSVWQLICALVQPLDS